jgi:ABC-type phosphate transport system auxiliary subunit
MPKGRPKGTKMMDVGGRRVLCWVQTGQPVKKQPQAPEVLGEKAERALQEAMKVLVSALKAVVEALQGEVATKEKDLKALAERNLLLEGKVKALEGQRGDQEKRLRTFETSLKALQAELDKNLQEIAKDFLKLKFTPERADLPLEVLKVMHGSLFQTSDLYRRSLKAYQGTLPKWATDLQV